MKNSQLLSVSETAEYLRLKATTIYHYVNKKKLSYYKLGNRVLFKVEDLDDFLHQNYIEKV